MHQRLSCDVPCTLCFSNIPYLKWHFRAPDCVLDVVFRLSEHWLALLTEVRSLHFHSGAETTNKAKYSPVRTSIQPESATHFTQL